MIPEKLITSNKIEAKETIGGTVGKPEVYIGGDDYISQPSLDTKTSAGAVGTPSYSTGYPSDHIPPTASGSASLDYAGGINPGTPGTDNGAKWERPHPQDAHPLANKQYQ